MQLTVLGTQVVIVQCTDRWYNKGWYLRSPPPWANSRMGMGAASPAQRKVTEAFARISSEANDKGLDRWQRRKVIAQSMRGKDFGGLPEKRKKPKRAPVPKATFDAALAAARRIAAG